MAKYTTVSIRYQIAQKVRSWRLKRKYTLKDLAGKANINYHTLLRYEQGTCGIPTERLKVIADALSIPIRNLFPRRKVLKEDSCFDKAKTQEMYNFIEEYEKTGGHKAIYALTKSVRAEEESNVKAARIRIAKNLVKAGFDTEVIYRATGLSTEEYGLGEILRWVKDRRKAIVEGVKFQRLRGTPASLKIALKWANIEDITIIEEPPGKHFFELQIGIKDVPNNFFVDAVVELAKLSLPLRSRLMRIFNDHYNVDRFILDESLFGSLLSDYSGIKVEKNGPVLSFGRINFFSSRGPLVEIVDNYLREHYEQAFSNDIYRLNVAVLGETEPHTKDYKGIYERSHQWYNLKALYPLTQSLLPSIKFAKAQIVLSDSWNLGETNACFPVGSIEEEGNKFVLGNDKLSGQRWNLKHKPILERFSVTHHYKIENYTDQKITKYGLAEHNVYYKNDLEQKDSIHELEKHILVFYPGVLKWHEHRHLHRSWKDSRIISLIS